MSGKISKHLILCLRNIHIYFIIGYNMSTYIYIIYIIKMEKYLNKNKLDMELDPI